MNAQETYWQDKAKTFDPRIAYLINGYIRDRLTISEHEELDEWVSRTFINQQIFEELTEGIFIDSRAHASL